MENFITFLFEKFNKRSRIYLECFQHCISGPGHSCILFLPLVPFLWSLLLSFQQKGEDAFSFSTRLFLLQKEIQKNPLLLGFLWFQRSNFNCIPRFHASCVRISLSFIYFPFQSSLFFLVFLHHSTILGFDRGNHRFNESVYF